VSSDYLEVALALANLSFNNPKQCSINRVSAFETRRLSRRLFCARKLEACLNLKTTHSSIFLATNGKRDCGL